MDFSETCIVLCLAVVPFLLMMNLSEAILHVDLAWEIPSSPSPLDIWSHKQRLQINDSIVFNYEGNKGDSVLEVSAADYTSCNRANPIASYNDGNTEIILKRSGLFFFISGAEGHCEKGEKVQIRVLAATHHHHNSTAAPTPSPLPNHHHVHAHAPAPAPAHHNAGSSLRVAAMVSAAAALIVALV